MNERSIFLAALERSDPAVRSAYLEGACDGDEALKARVEGLLKAVDGLGDFLERPAVVAETQDGGTASYPDPRRPIPEAVGTRIGPYKLLQEIGAGGMGVVFLAEQETPVRRKVALKVIKAGMDSEQILARFEAERQALALMDHPNIARVLDAGSTDSGRPYFVMELVKGIPITAYCDKGRLSTRERLELFAPVCRAIQHAHQKGIIHRDVKPSNVLVTEIDGEPVPKVIDFGVAKATGTRLTQRTMFTQFGAIVGTPEYMSPEQAALSGLDVDTRSDVYSLGVLLYELLTGSTPLDRESLRQAAFEEVLRRIREEEPPKPSTRLSSACDRLASVAATRRVEPTKLARSVRGDLDWIVMKALEKDRVRRYETASGLALDIGRYLDGDPVEAGPPTAAYKLKRFALKHRAALLWSGAFLGLIFGSVLLMALLSVRAVQAEQVAREQARMAYQAQAQAVSQRDRAREAEANRFRALEDTRKAQTATQTALEKSEEARRQAEAVSQFLVDTLRSPDPAVVGVDVRVMDVLRRAGERLESAFEGSAATRGALLNALGQTYLGLGLPDQARVMLSKAVEVRQAALGPDHADTLRSFNNLALALEGSGRADEAVALHERNIARMESVLGPEHPDVLEARNNLASAFASAGRFAEATALYERVVVRKEAVFGPDHPQTLISRSNLADTLRLTGREAEGLALLERTLPGLESKLGPDRASAHL